MLNSETQIFMARKLQSRIKLRSKYISEAESGREGLKLTAMLCRKLGLVTDGILVAEKRNQLRQAINTAVVDQKVDIALFKSLTRANNKGILLP